MTRDQEIELLYRMYGEPQSIREAVDQYNPATLIEQIRWWERQCEDQRERARRAERVLSRWQGAASLGIVLSILLAVTLWWRS